MDNIEEIWEKGNEKISVNETSNEEFIRKSISKTSISITSKLSKIVWIGIVVSLISILDLIYNISFYLNNTPILILIATILLLALSIFSFLLIQLRVINKMDTKELDLRELLNYKIVYFNTQFELVIHSVAISIVIATFCINLTMENNDGVFELYKILLLSIYYVSTYFITILLYKFTYNGYLKQLKNAIFNLEDNSLNSFDKELKKHKRKIRLIGLMIGLIFLTGIVFLLLETGRYII